MVGMFVTRVVADIVSPTSALIAGKKRRRNYGKATELRVQAVICCRL
jgi:hypothetical protein